MHHAEVTAWGEAPKYTEAADLPAPAADQVRIKVEAVSVSRVVRSRAAGQHYSSKTLPHVPGVDGVGSLPDGQKVYFTTLAAHAGGSFSEYVNVAKGDVIALPAGADPVQTAAAVNPALSSWMALRARAQPLPAEFTVLIVGATSASGRLAITLARSLGAKRVIGAARNEAALDELQLDERIVVRDAVSETDFGTLGDVDVVLDYVFGPLAEHLFRSLRSARPVQYVHIGGLGGRQVTVPGEALRSNNLTIRGSGPGAWTMAELVKTLPELLQAVVGAKQDVRVVPLKEIESEWAKDAAGRLVFVP